MNKPALGDYLIAHPFALPLWVGVYGYLFIIFEPHGIAGLLLPVLFLASWYASYFAALKRILTYHAQEETKEVVPCTEYART